jgi:hypothetical protein
MPLQMAFVLNSLFFTLAKLQGHKIEDCINSSYEVIAKRRGQMVNGTFVKEQ